MRKEICTYIANNSSFVIGTDLYSNFWDDAAPDTAVLVRGPSGPEGFDTNIHRATLQVVSRSKSQETAETNAITVYDIFHGRCALDMPVVVSGTTYEILTAEAVATPYPLGQDRERRHQFDFNIHINYIQLT